MYHLEKCFDRVCCEQYMVNQLTTRLGDGAIKNIYIYKKKTLDDFRHIIYRDQEALHINKGNVPQTVGRLSRNVFGTDLIGIQTQHSQLGEVCHVD